MAIYHDAYLFRPNDFVAAVMPYIESLEQDPDGYSLLRSHAIDLHDNNSRIRELSEEYGGWDRTAIVAQISGEHPHSPEDIAFWFVLMLYNHLPKTVPRPLGLGANLELMNKTLETLGWNDEERNELLIGKRFKDLIQLNRAAKQFDAVTFELDYWNYFRIPATGSQIGWLDLHDAQRLLEKLARDQLRLASIQIPEYIKLNIESVRQVYQSAIDMLVTAQKARCGLCLIISG